MAGEHALAPSAGGMALGGVTVRASRPPTSAACPGRFPLYSGRGAGCTVGSVSRWHEVTVELPDQMWRDLVEQAAREGVTPDEYAVSAVVAEVRRVLDQPDPSP